MHGNLRAMSRRATLLYDGDCGFCRWSIARVLRRDDRQSLRPLAIQSPEGERLLASVPVDERLESWHLVSADGRLFSGGAVFAPLSELLGHPGRARLLARVPGPTNRAYRLAAGRRGTLGPLIPRAAKARANDLIRARANGPAAVGPDAARAAHPAPVPALASPAPVAASSSGLGQSPPAAQDGSPAPTPPAEPRGWQQRLEESAFGRGLLSTLFVVTLIAIVAINLPESDLRRQLLRPGQPYLNALGLDQNWALFAPDPRRVVINVSAAVTFDDSVTSQWSFPHDGALIGTYRDYRWRKWAENLISPSNGQALWRSAALWAAGSEVRPGHSVTSVALVERYAVINPPGVTPSVGPTQLRVFYVLRLRPGGVAQ
jgi:predicted DCC family thiol-disulfide oxidoreductase YuxK